MKRALLVTSLVCSALVGCGDDGKPAATISNTTPGMEETDAGEQDGSSAGESGGGPGDTGTDPNPTSSTSPAETGSSSDGETTNTSGTPFIPPSDTPTGFCDPFTQDCPEGQKCQPFADDGGSSWNNDKCVPVTGDGVEGDACFAEGGGVAGLDDCAKGFFCWDTDAENNGFCVQLCTGSSEAGECENIDKTCAVYNMGTLPICLDRCDPLLQDCDPSDLCIPNPTGVGFLCVLDASGDEGQVFDPCMFANSCDAGLFCADVTSANECDPNAQGCCVPFCDITEPNDCMGDGQECVTIYDGEPDPELPNVGFCSIPM
jgi:hypothetical protein